MVTCNGVLYDGAIVIQNDRIFDVVKSRDDIPADAEIIDAKGAYVGPGFVDIHVLGCGSIDTYDASAAAVDHFLRHGTTTLLATPAYSMNFEKLMHAVDGAKKAMQKSRVIKGIYMEGPYTNPNYGAMSDRNPWRHGIVDDKFNVLNVMSEGVLYE